MNKLILNSYAKLNLYLVVLNKRRDGYHNLDTLFERISLKDKIILKSRRDNEIKIICNLPGVPKDQSNLAYKSAKLLQDKFNLKQGVEIKIIKRIPIGAGLGGGSSNAAAVLLGLNKLWKINLSQNDLAKLASEIGSDVAFFIYNSSFARARGRGERVKPLNALKKLKFWHILVVPKLHASTPLIYKVWDKQPVGLTRPLPNVKILCSSLLKRDVSLISKYLINNLEVATFKLYPEVARIKKCLISLGIGPSLMSGSGSAVFGIIPSRSAGVSLARKLKKINKSWQVFLAETV